MTGIVHARRRAGNVGVEGRDGVARQAVAGSNIGQLGEMVGVAPEI